MFLNRLGHYRRCYLLLGLWAICSDRREGRGCGHRQDGSVDVLFESFFS